MASWTYRLHWGPAGSLALDAETIGGSSLPLTLDPARAAAGTGRRSTPTSSTTRCCRLSRKDARDAARIAGAGQVAVAAYDELGRLVQATGVEVVGSFG